MGSGCAEIAGPSESAGEARVVESERVDFVIAVSSGQGGVVWLNVCMTACLVSTNWITFLVSLYERKTARLRCGHGAVAQMHD